MIVTRAAWTSAARYAFLAAAIVWTVLLPAAPLAAARPALGYFGDVVALAMYGAGHVICHQRPERSFFLWSVQMPVCARCTGIYVGGAIAAIAALATTARSTRRPKAVGLAGGDPQDGSVFGTALVRRLLMVAALPTAVTVVAEWLTGVTPSNVLRAAAGVPLGAAVVLVIADALMPLRRGEDGAGRT